MTTGMPCVLGSNRLACRRQELRGCSVEQSLRTLWTSRVVMKSKRIRPVGIVAISLAVSMLAVLGDRAIYAQDAGQAKFTVRVPIGLACSEFKGYESGQTVAISYNEKLAAVILANPVMINAYQSDIPGNGKPFPG